MSEGHVRSTSWLGGMNGCQNIPRRWGERATPLLKSRGQRDKLKEREKKESSLTWSNFFFLYKVKEMGQMTVLS